MMKEVQGRKMKEGRKMKKEGRKMRGEMKEGGCKKEGRNMRKTEKEGRKEGRREGGRREGRKVKEGTTCTICKPCRTRPVPLPRKDGQVQ
jgi:hypothetical protein